MALLLTIGFLASIFGVYLHVYLSNVKRKGGNSSQAEETPIIAATKAFKVPKPNENGENTFKLIVESSTSIVLAADPPIFMLQINVTNTYRFNVSRVEVLDYLPKDWAWKNVTLLFLYADGRVCPITPPHCEVKYYSETGLLNVTVANITLTIGKPMMRGETISLTLLMWYNLTGRYLPEQYREQTSTYVNKVKTSAWSTEGLKSNTAEASATIKMEIKLVDRLKDAVEFLKRMYNSTIGLCAEAPRVAPSTYWLLSDNLWAYKALEKYDPQLSSAIKSKLIELAEAYNLPRDNQGLPISYKHEAVIGDAVPKPFNEAVSYMLYKNDYALKADIANGTAIMEDWRRYADLLLYAALSSHWQGKEMEALELFNIAKNMWDGVGIHDSAAEAESRYATYKLALLLYTSRVLGQKLPFEEELIATILRMQDEETGGTITDYHPNGQPAENADANTETTAITIIALTYR